MDERVRSLEDRRVIEDLLIDYCRLLDRMELGSLTRLFAEECHVIYGPDPRLTAHGRVALEASLARMWRWSRTAHHLSNVQVWFEGADCARAESYVHAWHERSDGRTATLFGRYLDRVERTPEGWRIVERHMDMNGSDFVFRVPIPQAWRRPPPATWSPPEGLDD